MFTASAFAAPPKAKRRTRDPRVESFKQFMISHPGAPKMFGFSVAGAYWMEDRAKRASGKLSRALGRQKRSKKPDQPVVFNGNGVLYKGAIFRDSYFLSRQNQDGRSVKAWHDKQPWLKWDAKSRQFVFQKQGATQHLLSTLGDKVTVHRGASATEAAYWRGVKKYYTGKMTAADRSALTATLQTVAGSWELKPAAKARLNRVIASGFAGKLPPKAKRKQNTLFLLDLIAQRVDGEGYGAVSATPSLKTAQGWAKGTEKGKIWGRTRQKAEVLSFALDLKNVPKAARKGLYAGLEDGAFLKLPAYVEVAFITAEAKLYALERLK